MAALRSWICMLVCGCLWLRDATAEGEYEAVAKRDKFCGKRLVEMMQIVCNGVYYRMNKKNYLLDSPAYSGMINELDDYWMDTSERLPFQPRTVANSLIPSTFRRSARGLSDECCRKSCSMREMTSYCGR